MLLDTVIEIKGIIERLTVTCGTGKFRQAVDGEADGIALLLGVERMSMGVDAPKHTSILMVDKMVDDVTLGTFRHRKVFRFAQHPVGCRERP